MVCFVKFRLIEFLGDQLFLLGLKSHNPGMPAPANGSTKFCFCFFRVSQWTGAVVAVEMWETRSLRFPRKREIPRSWFLGDFPLPAFPPLGRVLGDSYCRQTSRRFAHRF